jgi:hypothetical protein
MKIVINQIQSMITKKPILLNLVFTKNSKVRATTDISILKMDSKGKKKLLRKRVKRISSLEVQKNS